MEWDCCGFDSFTSGENSTSSNPLVKEMKNKIKIKKKKKTDTTRLESLIEPCTISKLSRALPQP